MRLAVDVVAERLEQPPQQRLAAAHGHGGQPRLERERRRGELRAVLARPASALPKTGASATLRNDEATYGRSLTYCASGNAPVPRPRRTSPTGSTSSSSAAVQRSSLASG